MRGNSQINRLFFKYYSNNPALRRIVTIHSSQVAQKAIEICKLKHLNLNIKEVYYAAMLHDIGVVRCKAHDIKAKGNLPYLRHGIEGSKILIKNNLKKFSSICETHTGSGITKKQIIEKKLPLPIRDLVPKTLLEKLICYADKFYSKGGDLKKEKTLQEVMSQMSKFGQDSLSRFMEMHMLFS